MRVITKILLTILIFCIGSLLVQAIVSGMGNRVSSGGIGPFIIYPAMIAGIVAVWRYKPEQENDKHRLDKNQ